MIGVLLAAQAVIAPPSPLTIISDPPPIHRSSPVRPLLPWEKGPRKLAARIAWACTVKEDDGQARELAGSFDVFTGPGQSFARFTKDDSGIFAGTHALQADDRTWFLPDVSVDRPEAYYDAAFNFRTDLGQNDQDSGLVRLSIQRDSAPLKEYARGSCSKHVIFKNSRFVRLLKRYGAG